jgi:hypothetical protein
LFVSQGPGSDVVLWLIWELVVSDSNTGH